MRGKLEDFREFWFGANKMIAETQIMQQISKPNQAGSINSDNRKFVETDFELTTKGGNVVFEIKRDVFEFDWLEDSMKLIVNKEIMKKVKQSIEDSDKDWFECLKKAKGDYKKARELYKKY